MQINRDNSYLFNNADRLFPNDKIMNFISIKNNSNLIKNLSKEKDHIHLDFSPYKLVVYNKKQVVDIRDFFKRSIKQRCLTHYFHFNKRIRIYVFTYGLYSKKKSPIDVEHENRQYNTYNRRV